jgi:nicotinamidase-related amidase
VDDLTPREGEHLVVKKGFGGFANAPLDTILRNMGVTTCVVSGVTTCVCVSTTVRGGVEHNYRMILVPSVIDFAVNLRIDGTATTEFIRGHQGDRGQEVRGETQR